MLRRLKEWIIASAAFIIPALALAGVYAVLVRTYYLDSSAHRKLLLANAPVQSHFEHLRRKWGFHPERDIASKSRPPGEVIKGSVEPSTILRMIPHSPSSDSSAVTVVAAPAASIEKLLRRKEKVCEGLGAFELLSSGTAIAPKVELTAAERTQLIHLFETAKGSLLGWLFTQEKLLGPDLFVFMRDRIAETGMKLPPVDFEPDLELRAIVVWTRDPQGAPTIAVGSKFLRILAANPARAQFEFTRAMAQGWSPCEFNHHPWPELLRCFGVTDEVACNQGGFSEGGWAMSSLLAAYLNHPGCHLPAFNAEEITKCVVGLALPISATEQSIPNHLWKVGR